MQHCKNQNYFLYTCLQCGHKRAVNTWLTPLNVKFLGGVIYIRLKLLLEQEVKQWQRRKHSSHNITDKSTH